MGVNGEALQVHAVYEKPYFVLQVTRESVWVLQVTREYVSGTTSHARIISGTTSHVRCVWSRNKIEGSYDYHHSTKLYRKIYHWFVASGNVTCADGNKLMIFSDIALYYGDTSIAFSPCPLKAWVWSWYHSFLQQLQLYFWQNWRHLASQNCFTWLISPSNL